MRKDLSTEYRDAVVELAFNLFPSMDADDLARVVGAMTDLTAAEVAWAITRECLSPETTRRREWVDRQSPGPN